MGVPTLAPNSTWYTQGGTSVNKGTITTVNIVDSYIPAGTVTSSWDASAAKDGSVMAYVEGTKLTIAGNGAGKIYANADSSNMFNGFSKLTTVTGGNLLDTSKATTFERMFQACFVLESVDVSNWNTGNVTVFGQMFENCTRLTEIVGLEDFDTSKGVDFCEMFSNCYALKELDLSSFDTTKAKDGVTVSANGGTSMTLARMFNNTRCLEKITLGPNFSFNGDGTTTSNAGSLPTPDATYIDGANGRWYTFVCDSYAPSDIPNKTANTYYASRSIVENLDVLTKNGVFIDIADSIRTKNGSDERYLPSEMGDAIDALSVSGGSGSPIYAWRIRPAEAIYYERVIRPDTAEMQLYWLGESVNEFDGWYPYYEIAKSDAPSDVLHMEMYVDEEEEYEHSFYAVRENSDATAGTQKSYYGIKLNALAYGLPKYRDWEYKLSTNPSLYPTKWRSIIEIDGVEYECEYLGEQNAQIASTDYESGVAEGIQTEYDRFWDAIQANGTKKLYQGTFRDAGWTDDTFCPKYDIVPEGSYCIYQMFAGSGIVDLKGCLERAGVKMDFSKIANWNGAPFTWSMIENFPVLDCSNCTGTSMSNSNHAKYIERFIIKEDGSTTTNFEGCTLLEYIRFGGVIGKAISFKDSKYLSRASIEDIFAHLSTTTSGLSVTFSKTAVNNAFTTDEWSVLAATKSNWTINLV